MTWEQFLSSVAAGLCGAAFGRCLRNYLRCRRETRRIFAEIARDDRYQETCDYFASQRPGAERDAAERGKP